jgi:hypothetical protein
MIQEDEQRVPRKPGQPAKSDKHSDLYTVQPCIVVLSIQ